MALPLEAKSSAADVLAKMPASEKFVLIDSVPWKSPFYCFQGHCTTALKTVPTCFLCQISFQILQAEDQALFQQAGLEKAYGLALNPVSEALLAPVRVLVLSLV